MDKIIDKNVVLAIIELTKSALEESEFKDGLEQMIYQMATYKTFYNMIQPMLETYCKKVE